MDETTSMQSSDVVVEEGREEHHSRGRWAIIAGIAAAVIGSVFATRRVRSARSSRTPMTIA